MLEFYLTLRNSPFLVFTRDEAAWLYLTIIRCTLGAHACLTTVLQLRSVTLSVKLWGGYDSHDTEIIDKIQCERKTDTHLKTTASSSYELFTLIWRFSLKISFQSDISNVTSKLKRSHPQEQIPIAFSPRLIFCPSETRNCPSLTASPTFHPTFIV